MKRRKQQPQRYANLIAEIDRISATKILEIGTYKGGHAEQMIRAALKHGAVEYYGFDLFGSTDQEEYCERTVAPPMEEVEARLGSLGAQVVLVKGDTRTTLPAKMASLPVMDLIFIDGGHSDGTVLSDWTQIQRVMGPRTVVIFDDYWNFPEGGSNATVRSIPQDKFRVELLEPVDEFPRPYGSLRTQFVKVTRRDTVPLTIVTFLFEQPRRWKQLGFGLYTAQHVNALWRACRENIRVPHRFLCLTDQPDGIECETAEVWPAIHVNGEDGCYRRLHAFDASWQASLNTDYILSLDLDAVFLGDVTAIIEEAMRHEFTILGGSRWEKAGPSRGTLCSYYNGSMWLCRTGARPEFWLDFRPDMFLEQRARYRMPNGLRPHGSDQAWLTVRAGGQERTWGPEHGIVQQRTLKGPMPENVRLVFFAGRNKPWGGQVKRTSPTLYEAWRRYA